MIKDEKRALGSAALHRKELRRYRLLPSSQHPKDQISAKVEDGILTVTMPKTEPKQKVTKVIEVS